MKFLGCERAVAGSPGNGMGGGFQSPASFQKGFGMSKSKRRSDG